MAGGSKWAGIGIEGGAGVEAEAWRALSAPDLVEILDHLSDGIVVVDRDWRISYANEPAGAMVGRRHPDLLGKVLWSEFPEAVGHPFQMAGEEALLSGRPQRLIEHYGPLDRWFESRLYPQGDSLVVLFRDVTEEQLSKDELRAYVDRVGEAERIVGFGVWKWEIASGRVRWSDQLHRIYGMRPGEFGGTVEAFVERLHPEDRDRVWAIISSSLETHEPFSFEERIIRSDGAERVLLSQGRVILGPDGSPQALVGVCHDVTERARAEQALGASQQRIHAIIDNTPSMIAVKDLDGRYLMANAEVERVLGIRAAELVGMHGVDVLPREIAERQRGEEQRAASEGEPVYGEVVVSRNGEARSYVTVTFPLPGDDGFPAETCTIATDVTERKERESERRQRLERTEQIRSALAEGRMLVFSQPVVSLATGEQVSSELLVRLRTRGERPEILAPGGFLPAAERYDLIQQIDTWMVKEALALPTGRDIQVNISAVTICDVGARAEIAALLASSPEAARRLVFEVTETADVAQLEAAQAFAEEITDLGSRLALDDFGVGFGSFGYLRALPLSTIKIDISFVRGLSASANDRRVVRAIVSIAREFGLLTIAEGVEDAATLRLLRELGVDLAQGFYFGHPRLIGAGPVG